MTDKDEKKKTPSGEETSSSVEKKQVKSEQDGKEDGSEAPLFEKQTSSSAEKSGKKQQKSVGFDPAGGEKPVPRAPRAAAAGRARPAAGTRPRPGAARAPKEEKPEEPSPKQPVLDRFVALIKEKAGADSIEDAYINRPNAHLPTLVIKKNHWLEVATLLKEEPALSFDYVRNLSGVDYETHLEVVYHLISFTHSHQIGIRVKTDREQAKVPTVSHLWKTADWNEREIYDLLGVHFEGHPNLKRILMPDDWVGHPLRKDYEPLDKEV
ncbi:NADH-quinone oxidoreductase subunit C [Paenactinomyces guangxiensis]|uniref:NADH-quinone oxidoreductase subunit C n=1 Tax=Paenactinomyces guangxiensis TaxID=1490290 RepID=A0A7W2A9P6_9BACL|nr:NADH-quinone oxidoreductase subunit C [Paenactinomyces guangxiensis]MBA4495965.1 NADH-quinone oxidoreductase subunit C [Paenactinomyces guangxiensis]MBH8593048.1 NADH-quinone oxidoreductase subunit C [Paenactinomyces guangxiensis]